MSNILYKKLKKQISHNGGATWNDTNEFKVGQIIENPSNCSSPDSKKCRWIESPNNYDCDMTTHTKYSLMIEECTINDGLIWTPSGNIRRGDKILQTNSIDCGYVPPVGSDELKFEYSSSSNDTNYYYKLNGRNYTAEISPYLTSLKILGIDVLTDCRYTFYGLNYSDTKLTRLIEFPDTSNVTDMNGMFANCNSLTSLNLSNFNTSNVTDMGQMFANCNSLTSLDISKFDTSKVTDMNTMFSSCSSLTLLDLSHFNTSAVTNMGSMFNTCNSLTSLDLSNFNTSNLISMNWMFKNCGDLQTLNISSFNTSNVTDMDGVFEGCTELKSIDLSHFNTSKVTNMSGMFSNCTNLKSLNLSGWDTSNVTNKTDIFKNNYGLSSIRMCGCNQTTINMIKEALLVENINTDIIDDCINTEPIYQWVSIDGEYECDMTTHTKYNKEKKQVSNDNGITWNDVIPIETRKGDKVLQTNSIDCGYVPPVGSDELKFEYRNSSTGNLKFKLNNEYYTARTSPYSTSLQELGIDTLTNCYRTFYNCEKLTKLIEFPNTSAVTNMRYMFYNCSGLTSLDLSGWNTSNVTDMYSMFCNCNSLTSLDLSGWNASKVTDITDMFANCNSLTSLNLSGWNTPNLIDMSQMFMNCSGLTSLDLSSFNTSNVTDMSEMFYYCENLQTLNVSGWNTLQVTDYNNMYNMFYKCYSLNTLILGEVIQSQLDWWKERLRDANILSQVTIQYTLK